jgi:hypothetical protein
MAEPTTIRLTATAPLNGSGTIPLTREALQNTAAGRLYSATIPSGSRLTSDIFGIFSSGAHTSITVTASTDNPRDVLRVYLGAAVRSEHRLAGPQTITLAPGEELAFITEAPTVLLLVVNELAEADQTIRLDRSPPAVIRARLTRNAGFTTTGVMNVALHWSTSAHVLEATSSAPAGALPLEALDPRQSRYAGYYWRVRVSGCDGPAFVGPANRLTGDASLEQLLPGQWSTPRRVSHDDLLAVLSPPVRAGCPTVIAEHELLPVTEAQHLATAAAPTTPPLTQPAGAIPWLTFSDYSVNAAGAERSDAGYLMWTHAISGNPNVIGNKGFHGIGTGNKAMLGTDAPALLGLHLAQLTALSARYALRTAGNAHILNRPYINILIDVNGDGTLYKIGVLDRDPNPALNLLVDVAQADPTDHEYQLSWIGAGKLKIVNELPGVTPAVDLGAGWHNKIFQVSDILAVYPDAKLARAFPADNGLPADLTMPPLWLVLGDSTYTRYSRVLLREVRLNS